MRCCRDSVAMQIVAKGDAFPTEGVIVPCRWCSGYARYVHGQWEYADEEPIAQRHATQADLSDHPVRRARIADVLGRKDR